jgi:hypothetical protein
MVQNFRTCNLPMVSLLHAYAGMPAVMCRQVIRRGYTGFMTTRDKTSLTARQPNNTSAIAAWPYEGLEG